MKVLEKDFLKTVIELAHLCGWRIAHFRTSMSQTGRYLTAVQGDGAGFPDLVLVRDRVIFAELKSDKGKLSEAQEMWIYALSTAMRVGVYVWKPSDWDEIVEILK